MKIRYYLMSMAFLATASVSFTACDDDDDPVYEPITIVQPGDKGNIDLSKDVITLLIGQSEALPVNGGTGVKAYSLDTEIAQVVEEGGAWIVKAVGNGKTNVLVTDDKGNSDAFLVRSYKTDNITFSTSTLNLEAALLGYNGEAKTVTITDGNGKYVVESDNENVTATLNEETNEISVKAVGENNIYTATITVTDWMEKTAQFTVNVPASYTNPFDDATIEAIKSLSASQIRVYGVHDNHLLNENTPYYFVGSYATAPENWIDSDADGEHTFGWQMTAYGGFDVYGGFLVDYPSTATVGEEVKGTWKFGYSFYEWWPVHNFSGNVKVVRDDDTMKAVIYWGVNAKRPVVDYGWCVYVK